MKQRIIFEELKNIKRSFQVLKSQHLTLILFTNKSVNCEVEVDLKEEGAEVDIYGIILGQDDNEIKLHTLQHHQSSNTKSNLLVKSVLTDKSKFHYAGNIVVSQNAQKTNAYQRNENLMLSENARVESKPTLEIMANDVRCTHGATIGKINQNELLYLESRGIPKKIAQKLMITGFFQLILDKIRDKNMAANLQKKIEKVN